MNEQASLLLDDVMMSFPTNQLYTVLLFMCLLYFCGNASCVYGHVHTSTASVYLCLYYAFRIPSDLKEEILFALSILAPSAAAAGERIECCFEVEPVIS